MPDIPAQRLTVEDLLRLDGGHVMACAHQAWVDRHRMPGVVVAFESPQPVDVVADPASCSHDLSVCPECLGEWLHDFDVEVIS
jgi:hypothetical protein